MFSITGNISTFYNKLYLIYIQERRDELEGLDLAIERQKKSLKDLRREEKILQSERASAKEDLELISKENARFKRYRSRLPNFFCLSLSQMQCSRAAFNIEYQIVRCG